MTTELRKAFAPAEGGPIPEKLSLNRVPALDGLRGIAILLVLFAHLTVVLYADARGLLQVAGIGWIGVDLFFVLSGFLITGILLDSEGEPHRLKHFYLRRAARILPLYYAITFVSFVVLPHLLPGNKAMRFATVGSDEIWYWIMLPNVAIAKVGIFRHGIMDVSWSVAIEEHFYLVWPFVLSVLQPRRRMPFTIAVLLASMTLRTVLTITGMFHPNSLYVGTPTHLDGIAAGCFLALAVRGYADRAMLRRYGRVAALVGAIAFAILIVLGKGATGYYENPWIGALGYTAAAIGGGGVLLIAWLGSGDGSWRDRILSSGFLRTFGKYSYCLYFTNLPIRAVIRDRFITPESFARFPGGIYVGQLVFYVVAGSACLAVAMISWRLLEKPFLSLVAGHTKLPGPPKPELAAG